MSNSQSRIDRLKEMLSLEEQRETLQGQLEAIVERLNQHTDALFHPGPAPAAAPGRTAAPPAAAEPVKAAKAPKAPKAGKAARRAGRGALKERVFAALQSAGHAGVYVKELAGEIGTKPVNIHAWFHAAVKKYSQIKKLTGGHYRLEGALPKGESAAGAPAAPSAKARKVTAAPARNGAVKRSPRGELSSGILAALEAAGSKGASVSELADKVGVQYKNVSIWFATTGKKNSKVKRIARGQYRLMK